MTGIERVAPSRARADGERMGVARTPASARLKAIVMACLVLGLLWIGPLLAQTANDEFNPNINNQVTVIEQQRNGALLVGGGFSEVSGVTRSRVARIRSDGTVDPNFDPDVAGGVPVVRALHEQPGGKILIGGRFNFVDGQSRTDLARINANGTLDASFNVGVDNDVTAFHSVLSPDGLLGVIYIGGPFSTVLGQPRARVARLSALGALDSGFVPPAFVGQVNALRGNSGGGLIVAGTFAAPSAASVFRLSEVNGSLDNSFTPTVTTSSNPFGNFVSDVAVQPDGKLIITGDFNTVNGFAIDMIARLNTDGTVDASFDPPTLNAAVFSVDLQPDGRMVLGGDFTNVTLRNRVVRLNADGSLDSGFASGLQPDDIITSVVVLSDGWVAIAGGFTQLNGLPRNRMAKLSPDGVIDRTLATTGATDGTVEAIAYQPDGRLIVGGRFTQINGVARTRLARLSPTGSVDGNFAPTINGDVYAVAAMPDGKVIAGGGFAGARPRLARFLANGDLDLSFDAEFSNDGFVRVIAVQPDGKILIGGSFNEIGSQPQFRIARLFAGGDLDTTFAPAAIDGTVRAILVQADGRLMIGGNFTTVGGFQRNNLARLRPNGQFDSEFSSAAIADNTVYALAQLSGGNILVGGAFQILAGATRSRFGLLDANGELLASFSAGANGTVFSLAVRHDDRAYLGGSFTSIGGITRSRLALLNSNGTLGTDFSAGVDGRVETLLIQPDGKLVAGGEFGTAGPLVRGGIARFGASGYTAQSIAWSPAFDRLNWVVNGAGPGAIGAPQVLVSTTCCTPGDFVPFPDNSVMERSATAIGWVLEDFSGLSGTFYLRIRSWIGESNGGTSAHDSPIQRFEGGAVNDTIFADGFEVVF